MIQAEAKTSEVEAMWQSIETAPKDGTRVYLYGKPAEIIDSDGNPTGEFYEVGPTEVGWWWPEGTSWNEDCSELVKTGVWAAGGGWFQPDEVTHWMPLPEPPVSK